MGTDEDAVMSEYNERVTKVETQLAYVLVEQSNFRTILDKHNALLEALAKQTTAQDYQTRAVIDRTEQHSKEIERLQQSQVDTGKLFAAMDKVQEGFRVQIRIAQYVAGILLTLVVGYLFSLFIK
jgi:predicted phage tail protein